MVTLLKDEFLSLYPDFPKHMSSIGKFTDLRTYSRYDDEKGRREPWKETTARASQYNVGIELEHRKKLGIPIDHTKLQREAQLLFRNQFMLKQALSGRTLWVGGAKNGVADKFPLANFNCSFTNIEKWEDLSELFYLLLVGTGVGFKTLPSMARKMLPIRDNFTLVMDPYVELPKGLRSDDTRLLLNKTIRWNTNTLQYDEVLVKSPRPSVVTIHVGDSKEGWVEGVRLFFDVLTKPEYEHVTMIHFSYDSIRPAGERLKTFGGHASGHLPLLEMFQLFEKVIKGTLDDSIEPWERIDDTHVSIRPIGIIDMANAIGYNVVVGGVRRTAEIALFSGDPGEIDYEAMFMKYGINGLYGEKAFKHHAKVMREAKRNNIPLPKFFDDLSVRYYDVHHYKTQEDGSYILDADNKKKVFKATFTSVNEAIEFAGKQEALQYRIDSTSTDTFVPFPYNAGRPFHHRRMSNNSMAFHTIKPPNKRLLDFIFIVMKGEGEPGFINLYEASRRRLKPMGITDPALIMAYAIKLGLNPCAEILLHSKGVCNLTTVNVMGFVHFINGKPVLDLQGLYEAQRLSARSGLRMTLVTLELPEWDAVQKRDRLLGTSLTGWKDAMGVLGYSASEERKLLRALHKEARSEADRYAKELRVPAPLLVTTIKPEGTLSIVFGAVSSGLHVAHSPWYIRRIRINAMDALAKLVLATPGWVVHADVGTLGYTREEDLARPEVISQAKTLVIDFPVHSGAKKTKAETGVDEQFDTYFDFQKNYTEHNSSNTIHLQDHEWERACERIYAGWQNFVGVSFLSLDNNSYTLAPYETSTEERCKALEAQMQPLDFDMLQLFDTPEQDESSLEGMESCEGGVCPIR